MKKIEMHEANGPAEKVQHSHLLPVAPVQTIESQITGRYSTRTKKLVLLSILLLAGISICSVSFLRKKDLPPVKQAASVLPVVTNEKNTGPVADIKKEKEKQVRNDWSKHITVSSSNYGYGVLGGINNLTVFFKNNTDYPMDEITAKVVYIKANGKPWKTKFVTVYNVAPHSEKKQGLTKVNRGKAVEVTLHKIISKKLHFNYTSGKTSGDPKDPYLSK